METVVEMVECDVDNFGNWTKLNKIRDYEGLMLLLLLC